MNKYQIVKSLLLIPMGLLVAACGTTTVTVPMTIQSDPLGGHVTYQLPTVSGGGTSDWIYLGKTPIDLDQPVDKRRLKEARSFRVKVFRDGYNDQVRDWSEDEIEDAVDEMGHIFWNPKLVPHE